MAACHYILIHHGILALMLHIHQGKAARAVCCHGGLLRRPSGFLGQHFQCPGRAESWRMTIQLRSYYGQTY